MRSIALCRFPSVISSICLAIAGVREGKSEMRVEIEEGVELMLAVFFFPEMIFLIFGIPAKDEQRKETKPGILKNSRD